MGNSSVQWTILRAGTALAMVLACAPALAQQTTGQEDGTHQVIRLDKVTVLVDRQGTDPHEVAASVTVVDGQQIVARGLTDMKALVRYSPGVEVQRQTSSTDPFSSFGGFSIRGVGGNRVQMLVDGARVPERIQDGTRDYLDLTFTRQVEIAKGPASTLWGADALGGVVAIETIDPEDILRGRDQGGQAHLSHETQSGTSQMSAAFAQRMGDWSVMMGVSRTDAHEARLSQARDDGGVWGCPRNVAFGATPCGHLNPMDIGATRFLGKAVWDGKGAHRLEFSVDWLKRKTDVQYNTALGVAASGVVTHYDHRHLDTHRKRFSVQDVWTPGLQFVDEVKTTLSYAPAGYARSGERWTTNTAGAQIVTNDHLAFDEDFLELDVQVTTRFATGGADHVLTWGFDGDRTTTDYERIDVTRNLTAGTTTEARAGGFNFANADTRRADIYLQDQITLLDGALELTPGLRFATYRIDPRPNPDYKPVAGSEPRDREGDRLLKSLGALYRFGDGWQVWGHYSEGFKMPTAQQLYTSLPGSFFDLIPAPDLRPETVKSYELGIRRQTDRGFFSVTAFNADYDDFIQNFYNPPGTNDYTYRNLSELHVWGIEMEAAYEVNDRLRLNGSLSWIKGDQRYEAGDPKTPATLPPLSAVLGVSWDTPQDGLTLDLVGRFASRVHYVESEDNFRPAGYGVFDAFARWDINEDTVLNLGVSNIFDRRYFEASAAHYGKSAPASVAAANPIELQTGAGRVFTAALDYRF